jgi:hypothetical protein
MIQPGDVQVAAMVNPLDVLPVLALVLAIVCIPLLGDQPGNR